mgnify:CR=1 FL=1
MKCDLPREELSAYLDGELDHAAAAHAAAHAERCLECREALGAWRGLEASLRLPPEAPPAALKARLALDVRRTRTRRVAARAGVLAALAFAAWYGFTLAQDESDRPEPTPYSPALLDARVVAGTGRLIDALEFDAAALKLELSTTDASDGRRRALEQRLDDLLRRVDDARLSLASRR